MDEDEIKAKGLVLNYGIWNTVEGAEAYENRLIRLEMARDMRGAQQSETNSNGRSKGDGQV